MPDIGISERKDTLALPLKNPNPVEVKNLQTGDWHTIAHVIGCPVPSLFMWLISRLLTTTRENFLLAC